MCYYYTNIYISPARFTDVTFAAPSTMVVGVEVGSQGKQEQSPLDRVENGWTHGLHFQLGNGFIICLDKFWT